MGGRGAGIGGKPPVIIISAGPAGPAGPTGEMQPWPWAWLGWAEFGGSECAGRP